jgi:hypothetical protein
MQHAQHWGGACDVPSWPCPARRQPRRQPEHVRERVRAWVSSSSGASPQLARCRCIKSRSPSRHARRCRSCSCRRSGLPQPPPLPARATDGAGGCGRSAPVRARGGDGPWQRAPFLKICLDGGSGGSCGRRMRSSIRWRCCFRPSSASLACGASGRQRCWAAVNKIARRRPAQEPASIHQRYCPSDESFDKDTMQLVWARGAALYI